jgi:hypothetical protein
MHLISRWFFRCPRFPTRPEIHLAVFAWRTGSVSSAEDEPDPLIRRDASESAPANRRERKLGRLFSRVWPWCNTKELRQKIGRICICVILISILLDISSKLSVCRRDRSANAIFSDFGAAAIASKTISSQATLLLQNVEERTCSNDI